MIVIGIDIGLAGAVAMLDGDRCQVEDLPTLPDGDKSRRLHGGELRRMLLRLCPAVEVALIAFEDVRVRPGRAFSSETSLLRSRGIVEGVIDCTPFDAKAVQPQAWKRHFGLIKAEKGASLAMARRLFPSADLRLVKHHNRAEALLIALYARGKFA